MQLDDTSRRVIDQYLQARLRSAQASLKAARLLNDNILSSQATEAFMEIADLLRRWHKLSDPTHVSREHRGKLLIDYFRNHSQFSIIRSKKLPLMLGDEEKQTTLIKNLWDEFFYTLRLIPVQINQRGDRLTFRFDYRRLPGSYHQIFSRRNPTSWLMGNLTLPNLIAWLWYQEFTQAGIHPSAIPSQPHRFSLSFTVITQLTLPLKVE